MISAPFHAKEVHTYCHRKPISAASRRRPNVMILRSAILLLAAATQQAGAKPYIGTHGASDDAPVVPLVTGCGRAGTHTAGELLLSLGVKAVHEGAAVDAVAVSWFYGTEQSFQDVDKVSALPQQPKVRRG